MLGEGGMGIVYKARQLSLNRPVALKMIKATRFPSSDEVAGSKTKPRPSPAWTTPTSCRFMRSNQFEDQHYFAMKLIAGESLDKRLKEYTADPKLAARLVATTAAAIHHAHQRGILHRDLKPANILVDPQGQPHVTDFGLAKRVEGDSELTRSGAIVGTPAYMAPEQASGKKGAVTTSTDVYGLGAILYAMLDGAGTVRRDDGHGHAGAGAGRDRPNPAEVQPAGTARPGGDLPEVPREGPASTLCQRRTHLPRSYVAGWPASRSRRGRWGNAARVRMWCLRNPVLAWSGGLVAASLLAVVVLSLLYADRQANLAKTERLRFDEQIQHNEKLANDAAMISAQAKDLETQRQSLKSSLADSNRRLAMQSFEAAPRAFDSGQANRALLWLVECWRYAKLADDRAWQHLARANLSFWRYNTPEIKGVFSNVAGAFGVPFSPDGKTILTRSETTSVRLWDAASCNPVGLPITHKSFINLARFSPDGKMVVTGSYDKTARVWDAATGLPVGSPLQHQNAIDAVAFSPDSKTVVTCGRDGTAQHWNATTSQLIGRPMIHGGQLRFVAFSSKWQDGPYSRQRQVGTAVECRHRSARRKTNGELHRRSRSLQP